VVTEEDAGAKYSRLNHEFPIYEELKRTVLNTTRLGAVLREDSLISN